MSTTFPPQLPLELIEEIILRAWDPQCTTSERIILMTSLPLVNRVFLAAYLRISSVNVHIPCPSFVNKFLRALREGGFHFPIVPVSGSIAEHCRSITLRVVPPGSPMCAVRWSTEPPMGVALSDLLYNLRLFGGLPNFRTLTIRYIDVDLNDIFDWARFIDFPQSVESLNLEFVQTETDVPPPKIVITPPGRSPCNVLWTLPYLRHLRVIGGNDELLSRVCSSIPNLRTLDIGSRDDIHPSRNR